jgi:hypothetical protein
MKFLFVSTVFALPIPQKAKAPTTESFRARLQTKGCTLDRKWGVWNIAGIAPAFKCFKQVWCELRFKDNISYNTKTQLNGLEKRLPRCLANSKLITECSECSEQAVHEHITKLQEVVVLDYMSWLRSYQGIPESSIGREEHLEYFKYYYNRFFV